MNKNELIKKITNVVSENSKKGVITTTKFVGTYNYKSGYDTYFAVSFDLNKELIVYSWYQNDRGELIDVPTYKLNDLKEKELAEVWENINAKDEEIENYIYYAKIFDKNLKILAELGIYKPKKEVLKRIDITKIPELENDDDAYLVDRNENVHIVKCIGKDPTGVKRFFDVSEQPYDYKACTIVDGEKRFKNDGIFFVLDGSGYSKSKYAYFPNKEKLLEYAEKEKEIKKYFIVTSYLESYSTVCAEKPKLDSDDEQIFTEKGDAEKYFDEVKFDVTEKLNTIKLKLEEKKKKLNKIIADANVVEIKSIYTPSKDAIPNKAYMYEVDKNVYLGPFKVIGVKNGVAIFENGIASKSWYRLVDVDILEKAKKAEKYKAVFKTLEDVERYIENVDNALKCIATAKPFVSEDFYIPTWLIIGAEECLEEDTVVGE